MFYDRFIQLCNDANVTPSYVADTLGLNKSTVYMWKKQGTSPRYTTRKKIADYFGVDVDSFEEPAGKNNNAKSFEESEICRIFRRLTVERQKKLFDVIKIITSDWL